MILVPLYANFGFAALVVIDGKARREPFHLLANPRFHLRVFLDALLRQRVQHFDEHFADLTELGDAEPAAGPGRRAEPDTRGDGRLLRVERDAVLVAGDVGAAERDLGDPTGEPLGPQVDQYE